MPPSGGLAGDPGFASKTLRAHDGIEVSDLALALEDDQAMTEISVAQEIAASRQRSIPADEGKPWETVRLDAERAAAGEEMLRGFLDLVVLRHDNFSSGLGLLLASAQARRVFNSG
jgi:hypothetical protein